MDFWYFDSEGIIWYNPPCGESEPYFEIEDNSRCVIPDWRVEEEIKERKWQE